jgi:predicted Zn-dependent protease
MVSEARLRELAERALAAATGEAQVTVGWERGLVATGGGARADEALVVEVTAVHEGGLGEASTSATAGDAPARVVAAAERAAAASRDVAARLPDPVEGARAHDGFDPAVAALDPAAVELPADTIWEAGVSRVLVRSTRGVDAFEQRSFVRGTYDRRGEARGVRLTAAAVRPGGLDLAELAREGERLGADPAEGAAEPGEPQTVLGPQAVADVLEWLRRAFSGTGEAAGLTGRRIAAACVNLSDSARSSGTLPRSHDAEGLPRRPVPLVQDGVAHRVVWDTVSAALRGGGAASTGHAGRTARPLPLPYHFVLVGGGATDEAELARPVDRGLYLGAIPALDASGAGVGAGAFAIRGGEIAEPLADPALEVSPLGVLAAVQALTMRQSTIPTGGSARHVGATLAPAVRAAAGIRVR